MRGISSIRRGSESDRRVRYIAAWFRSEDEILGAARDVRAAGYSVHDAYTPYPVHGMDDAVGLRRSRLTSVALFAALAGLAFSLTMQIWVSTTDWPMNIGGKPSAPMALFVPIAFEHMVLFGGLATVAAFLVLAKLRPGARKPLFEGACDDRFVLVLRQDDGSTDIAGALRIFQQHRAVTVLDGVEAS